MASPGTLGYGSMRCVVSGVVECCRPVAAWEDVGTSSKCKVGCASRGLDVYPPPATLVTRQRRHATQKHTESQQVEKLKNHKTKRRKSENVEISFILQQKMITPMKIENFQ